MTTTTVSSSTSATLDDGCTPRRRVRHEVRDAVAVMAFSATASFVLAVALMLLVRSGS